MVLDLWHAEADPVDVVLLDLEKFKRLKNFISFLREKLNVLRII